ncbi:ArsA family ATPase [Anaeroselena agilis]|uniref:ArsA family ATPase n=1 Tax=Anaeroselena agilis TaxID=3063788 RepID=A0ABU3NU17_9FIRM|nr:ArsA family ATPase [Selenomonadales bacterium 4137-cl]
MNKLNELLYPQAGKRKHIFFSGKGGVGKTSMACVTAVEAASQGYRTLLMTTDPAAHIGSVLERPVLDEVTQMEAIPNLYAIKIDPKQAAEDYKHKILEDAKQKFSASTVLGMEEELNSPCTEEMAAFQKFIDYASQDDFDVIVIDTAPTGHTLRLLELPMDWSKQLQLKAGLSAEVSDEDRAQQAKFDKMIAMMKDQTATTFAFVMYPEKTPIIEAYRASQELASFGIQTQLVVANLIIPAEQATTPFFQNRRNMQLKYIEEIKTKFTGATLLQVPLFNQEIKGIGMLNTVAKQIIN